MRSVWILLLLGAFWGASAQTPQVIPLKSEPHHHLALHNAYVNVYQVEVKPHDSVLLHRHDYDAISVMLDDAQVTVHAPSKPDVHQDLQAAQVRLQPKGYVHQTAIDGEKLYRNVTVELLQTQSGEHNLCAVVMAGQPLHCESNSPGAHADSGDQPQFGTDRTTVTLNRVKPGQELHFEGSGSPVLIIVLDGCSLHSGSAKQRKALRSGDFVWLDNKNSTASIKNDGNTEVRLVRFEFKN